MALMFFSTTAMAQRWKSLWCFMLSKVINREDRWARDQQFCEIWDINKGYTNINRIYTSDQRLYKLIVENTRIE